MTFPVVATLPDGSRVDVVEGPTVDRAGGEWYRVVGRARPGVSGWAAGVYLAEVDASQPDPPQVASARAAPPTAPAGRSLSVRVTAYAHGTRTASGTPVRWGVIAVDPKVIPLGSRVMIDGFDNVFVAEDTGGGVRGNHIDIYFPDVASALRFGVQTRTITVLN
jgi:3D (Asp-Asp-Asp) domain-containing protein